MSISVKVGGAWKAVSAISIKKAGAWKLAAGIGIVKDNAWKTAFGAITPGNPPLSGSASPSPVNGSRNGAGSLTSPACVITPAGGTAAFTYAWTKVSGSTFTINSAASATTTFTTTLTNGQSLSGVYRCTITDSLGVTTEIDVPVNMEAVEAPPLVVGASAANSETSYFFPGSPYSTATRIQDWNINASGGNGSYTYNLVLTIPSTNSITWQSTGRLRVQVSYRSDTGPFPQTEGYVEVTDTSGASGTLYFTAYYVGSPIFHVV